MKIIHKETKKTIHLHQINNSAGYRERIAFAANIAGRHDVFGNHRVVSARYIPHRDKWFGDGGNFVVCQEASISSEQLESLGFLFTDDVFHF